VGNPKADKGLALLDGMKIDVRQSVGRDFDLLAMHVGDNNDS
jgi:hypothetical protein